MVSKLNFFVPESHPSPLLPHQHQDLQPPPPRLLSSISLKKEGGSSGSSISSIPLVCLHPLELPEEFRPNAWVSHSDASSGSGGEEAAGRRTALEDSIFTPSSALLLDRAASAREITLLNPLWIHSHASGKPFYAILHRIDIGIVIDLEPARTEDPALSIAGTIQSQKLAVQAISRLQSLPGGDIKLLCDTVVDHVRELTGYDVRSLFNPPIGLLPPPSPLPPPPPGSGSGSSRLP